MERKFIQPCFVRKSTPEIRKKLEAIGYKKQSPDNTDNCNIIFAYQYPMDGFDTPSYVIADSFDIPFDKSSCLCGKFIDCGTNEDLFIAIAALRSDSDYMQWFTDGSDFYLHESYVPFTFANLHLSNMGVVVVLIISTRPACKN